MVLKWRDIYIENIRMVPLTAGLKMEGTVKWRGLKPCKHVKSQGPLYIVLEVRPPQLPKATLALTMLTG